MRIKILLLYCCLGLSSLFAFATSAHAACKPNYCEACSGCGGVQDCRYSGQFTTDKCTGDECRTMNCYNSDYKKTVEASENPYGLGWEPGGSPGTVCYSTCDPLCLQGDGVSCVYSWAKVACTLPGCPSGPDPTSTPTSAPTAVPKKLKGSVQKDIDAVLTGNSCSQETLFYTDIKGYNFKVRVTNPDRSSATYTTTYSEYEWSVDTKTADTLSSKYTVTLDLSGQTGATKYVCSCPAPLDPANPYLCRYTDVPVLNFNLNNSIDFYVKEQNLINDSWFQVFGGSVFSRNGVSNLIPYGFCGVGNTCQTALNAPAPSSANLLSSGFVISNIGDSNKVRSSNYISSYHSYFHLPERAVNLNSYDVDTDLNQLSYDYFYKLAENSLQKIGNGEDLEPLLSDWTNAPWWVNDDINYIAVYGTVNIDETQGFNLSSNQQLVVFVDGNLILDDSDTNDSNRKITSVAPGGFLAFFVSGDIIITADVGYELNPLVPSTPAVSNANSNLEGVFVANSNLIMQSKNAIGEVPPDRKFIGAGTFVGWNNVLLNRTFNDNNFGPILSNSQAIENFIYRPDLLANWPTKLKASTSNWREVDPQFINQ